MVSRNMGGSIVLIASISGHATNFPQPQVNYNISKAGVLMMCKNLAAEWGRYGITVNSISPGYMDTVLNESDELDEHKKIWLGRTPLGRIGGRDELNGAVVLLCSDAARFITGTDIKVDGMCFDPVKALGLALIEFFLTADRWDFNSSLNQYGLCVGAYGFGFWVDPDHQLVHELRVIIRHGMITVQVRLQPLESQHTDPKI